MGFNFELYRKYRDTVGKEEKDGMFTVTRFPNGQYCFPTKQWLGDNGKIDGHPFFGKKVRKISNGKIYVVDSVNIHWYNGYYYVATIRDDNNSHGVVFFENINCEEDIIIKRIEDFKEKYEILN